MTNINQLNQLNQLNQIKAKILPILQQYGVKRAYLFGSTVRGDATATSDIDLAIDKINQPGYFAVFSLQDQLEKTLKKKVDLVFDDYIKPLVRPYIDQHKFSIL
jgi:predicted nucleotidyltransferase